MYYSRWIHDINKLLAGCVYFCVLLLRLFYLWNDWQEFDDFLNSMPVLKCWMNLNLARICPVYCLGCLCLEYVSVHVHKNQSSSEAGS